MPFRNLPVIMILCCCALNAWSAGDTIVDRNGGKTEAKVLRVLPGTVEYKKPSNPDGPVYVVERCTVAEIIYSNGERDTFTGECAARPTSRGVLPTKFGRFTTSLELPFGAFGLFNVDNKFTKAKYTFGATPSFMVRLHRNFAAGAECMLLWGQVDTADSLRFIINPNLRGEVLFPLSERLTLGLIAAAGLSVWPVMDTVGVLDTTFFHQRGGWNARAAFGAEWKLTSAWSLLCNVGYSASSSESDDVWITHDMMMVSVGMRWMAGSFSARADRR
jgi:hypothetical protein